MEGHNAAKRCFINKMAKGLPAAVEEMQVSGDVGSVGAPVGASDGTPPTKRQRIWPFGVLYDLPDDRDVNADVVTVMARVCEAVRTQLPVLLKKLGIVSSEVPLHEYPSFNIKSVIKNLSSYKEPWRKSRAVMAISSTSMYEAGGNPFWFSTTDSTDEFPRATVS